jgi:D-alanine-D-alanine ligase
MKLGGLRKTVGVLRGGPSSLYELSLKTGKKILSVEVPGYKWKDLFIDKHGVWYLDGLAKRPVDILNSVDGIFNALHGTYGEDGSVQEILDIFGVPYTGSGRVASALATRKDLSLNYCSGQDIKTPTSLLIREGDNRDGVFSFSEKVPFPLVVKPVSSSFSAGICLVSSNEELSIAIENAFRFSSAVLVQEFIEGKEATCGVVEGLRGEDKYSLFPVEIVPNFSNFFDYEEKYIDKAFKRCPGNFSEEEKREIQRLAVLIHTCLGLRHYSRSDFVVTPRRGIYMLEVNALPDLMENSLFTLELEASGVSFEEFLQNILNRIFI